MSRSPGNCRAHQPAITRACGCLQEELLPDFVGLRPLLALILELVLSLVEDIVRSDIVAPQQFRCIWHRRGIGKEKAMRRRLSGHLFQVTEHSPAVDAIHLAWRRMCCILQRDETMSIVFGWDPRNPGLAKALDPIRSDATSSVQCSPTILLRTNSLITHITSSRHRSLPLQRVLQAIVSIHFSCSFSARCSPAAMSSSTSRMRLGTPQYLHRPQYSQSSVHAV